ncbi:hypothetical protein SAMN05216319_3341 [Duganella sp. CF402]|uniref:hypothetical protein n=1 Tax=unclassified Duganella TaxID=2636909 RepID=UPI0008D12210|nr:MULTISPECIES: hypothetical protein [unclassified Duganella]RZT08245.1 hypothetical protein EV582_0277 [Duganella sp. BK701]SEM00853.1 hypothetical protein SAMN05216319_3341 [Duganella sp. CF402]
MNDKKAAEEALIAKYRVDAAARRKSSKAKDLPMGLLADKPLNGVFTVRVGKDAKTLSALGGIVKVFGHSRIVIPEMKRRRG